MVPVLMESTRLPVPVLEGLLDYTVNRGTMMMCVIQLYVVGASTVLITMWITQPTACVMKVWDLVRTN